MCSEVFWAARIANPSGARSGSLQDTVSVHDEECTVSLAADSGEPHWWNAIPASLGRHGSTVNAGFYVDKRDNSRARFTGNNWMTISSTHRMNLTAAWSPKIRFARSPIGLEKQPTRRKSRRQRLRPTTKSRISNLCRRSIGGTNKCGLWQLLLLLRWPRLRIYF